MSNTVNEVDRIGLDREIKRLARYYTREEILNGVRNSLADLYTYQMISLSDNGGLRFSEP